MSSDLHATVIVPTTGDRGPLLPFSVGSILAQTVQDLEVFVIGDGVSEQTREIISDLIRQDRRVRFFDHPKDVRRGEPYRHSALAEARGKIVCYLTDRDLMLANHVASLSRLLSDSDFAHTLRFVIRPDGNPAFEHTLDINDPVDRGRVLHVPRLIPLSFAGHTLDMYRRLPHGWRRTPTDKYTDRYMWEQFLTHPACRTATSTWPTILYFKRGKHPGWATEKRLEELKRWHSKIGDPSWVAEFEERVRDAAIRDRARLGRIFPDHSPRNRSSAIAQRIWAVVKRPKRLVSALPAWLTRRIRYYSAEPPRSVASHISELEVLHVQQDIRVEVYWIAAKLASGPAASVYVFDDEVMRFDCFGSGRGHMHLNLKQSRLIPGGGGAFIRISGGTQDDIDRAYFDLNHNLEYCLRLNRNPRVRKIRLNPERLSEAAGWMRDRLTRLAAQYASSDPVSRSD
jgi:glycosyltransferase involved in cell wall biosynthesis